MGCLRTYLGQVAPNRYAHVVVCGSMEDMERSASQWHPSRVKGLATIQAIQRVDLITGKVRSDAWRLGVTKHVTAAVEEVVRDRRSKPPA